MGYLLTFLTGSTRTKEANKKAVFTLILILVTQNPAFAADSPWTRILSLDYFTGDYRGDTAKSGISAYGFSYTQEFLDSHHFSLGYNSLSIDIDDGTFTGNTNELSQDTLQFEAITHIYTDWVHGKISPGIQYQNISGDLSDPLLGDVSAIGALLRYLNNDQNLYLDGHYSLSSYDENIDVDQFDVALGSNFKNPRHWFQIRAYNVSSTSVTEDYQFIDLSYKRWLSSSKELAPTSAQIAFTIGDSLLGVDPETQSVWNLYEERTQYMRLGFNWNIDSQSKLSTLLSYSKFTSLDSNAKYDNLLFFLQLAINW